VTHENRAHLRTIFMIRHPSYPSIWAYVTHVTLDPRLPLFSLACVGKDRGASGDEAIFVDSCMMQASLSLYFCSLLGQIGDEAMLLGMLISLNKKNIIHGYSLIPSPLRARARKGLGNCAHPAYPSGMLDHDVCTLRALQL
jgi:hypothetical protein